MMDFDGNDDVDALGAGDSYYIAKFVKSPKRVFRQLNDQVTFIPREELTFKIFGKVLPLPRDKQFYGDIESDGRFPLYRYGGDYVPQVHSWVPIMEEMRDLLIEKGEQDCNHAVVNRYKDGSDHIGYHHDKTRDFTPEAKVCTMSFGTARHFYLKNIETGEIQSIILQPGSLFVLGPETNESWKHAIPKRSPNVVPEMRISLTFRNISTTYNPTTKEIEEN